MKGILLISGNATSGKDTFFTGLKLIFGDSVKRFAFADALKIDTSPLAHRIFNKTISSLSKDEKELFRPLLVDYGNIMRKVNPLYWIEQVDNEIKKEDSLDYAIITDCRYENEIEFFKKIILALSNYCILNDMIVLGVSFLQLMKLKKRII